MNWTEIIIALLGVFGTLGSALIGQLRVKRAQRQEQAAEREMGLQRRALDLDFSSFAREWQEFNHELRTLIDETEVDRFLILRAWNGRLSPKWTTATLQVRTEGQKIYNYVHFELDADYVSRMQQTISNGAIRFQVKDISGDSLIKDVYEAEGVVSSAWFHIASHSLDEEAKAISYCSFASHDEPISDETMTRCRILVGRLKGFAANFSNTDTAA